MANNINTVVITGNLTRDPELRHLPSGSVAVEFGIANNRSYQRDDEWIDDPSFFDVTIFGRRGETVAEKFCKGDFATVSGRLQQDTWENDEGERRSKVRIVAFAVEGEAMFRTSGTRSFDDYEDDDDDIPF